MTSVEGWHAFPLSARRGRCDVNVVVRHRSRSPTRFPTFINSVFPSGESEGPRATRTICAARRLSTGLHRGVEGFLNACGALDSSRRRELYKPSNRPGKALHAAPLSVDSIDPTVSALGIERRITSCGIDPEPAERRTESGDDQGCRRQEITRRIGTPLIPVLQRCGSDPLCQQLLELTKIIEALGGTTSCSGDDQNGGGAPMSSPEGGNGNCNRGRIQPVGLC